jgi:hypothetical protein
MKILFQKAHIKISYMANFQKIWTLPHRKRGDRMKSVKLK